MRLSGVFLIDSASVVRVYHSFLYLLALRHVNKNQEISTFTSVIVYDDEFVLLAKMFTCSWH